nr:uncharacterized protein CFP56_03050 [Quercus suber]
MAMSSSCTIQIMSDLHLETHPTYDYDFPQTAPYLALPGDIGHVATEHLIQFLIRQLLRYRVVFFLLGNHEPYHMSWDFAKERMIKFEQNSQRLRANDASIGKFVFLEKTRFDLDDNITILGCTLFTNVTSGEATAVQSRMVDFRDIINWDVGDHVEAHLEDLQWLNRQVSEVAQSGRTAIIFTHHSPSTDPRARNPRYGRSEVDSGFATNLCNEHCWTNKAVVLWAFGHTHYNCDFVDDYGKRVMANQKGYYLIPQKTFQPGKTIEISSSAARTISE